MSFTPILLWGEFGSPTMYGVSATASGIISGLGRGIHGTGLSDGGHAAS